jgi:hypothetical protein
LQRAGRSALSSPAGGVLQPPQHCQRAPCLVPAGSAAMTRALQC